MLKCEYIINEESLENGDILGAVALFSQIGL
jgi:hypothetical protein